MYLCGYVHMRVGYQQRTEEGAVDKNSRTSVLGGFELPDVGVGRGMWILYSKSSIVLN